MCCTRASGPCGRRGGCISWRIDARAGELPVGRALAVVLAGEGGGNWRRSSGVMVLGFRRAARGSLSGAWHRLYSRQGRTQQIVRTDPRRGAYNAGMSTTTSDLLRLRQPPHLDRRHPGARPHRLDGRRRRLHRHGPPAGGPARRPAHRRDRPRAVLPLQFPRLDGAGRPVPAAHQDRGRPGRIRSTCRRTSSTATSRPTWSSSSARSRTCTGGAFGDCVLELARRVGVRRVLFVGSFGGSVPHTREPRLYVTCSDAAAAAGDGAATACAAPATRGPARSPATC